MTVIVHMWLYVLYMGLCIGYFCLYSRSWFFVLIYVQNVVLSGGSTMFKDFNRRLQRDLKKIVDARVLASDARLGGEAKVSIMLSFFLILLYCLYNPGLISEIFIFYFFASGTTGGSQCSQPSYPEIRSLVWRFCTCINTWIFHSMIFSLQSGTLLL